MNFKTHCIFRSCPTFVKVLCFEEFDPESSIKSGLCWNISNAISSGKPNSLTTCSCICSLISQWSEKQEITMTVVTQRNAHFQSHRKLKKTLLYATENVWKEFLSSSDSWYTKLPYYFTLIRLILSTNT